MARIFFLLLFLPLLPGCHDERRASDSPGKVQEKRRPQPERQPLRDTIDRELSGYRIFAERKDSNITLRIRPEGVTASKEIKLRYPGYSEVCFPLQAIGVLQKGSFSRERALVLHDSILLLPVIGFHNRVSSCLINLRSDSVIADDVRTAFAFIWVRHGAETELFFADDSPEESNKTRYTIHRVLLKGNRLINEGQKQIVADGFISRHEERVHHALVRKVYH